MTFYFNSKKKNKKSYWEICSLSLNLSSFLIATKKNTENFSYFQLLYLKLVCLRTSTHKFFEIEEQFYYALATYNIHFILFSTRFLSPCLCNIVGSILNSFLHWHLKLPLPLKTHFHLFPSSSRGYLTIIWQLKTLLKVHADSPEAWRSVQLLQINTSFTGIGKFEGLDVLLFFSSSFL